LVVDTTLQTGLCGLEAPVRRAIRTKRPEQLKLESGPLTRGAIMGFIQREFSVRTCPRGL